MGKAKTNSITEDSRKIIGNLARECGRNIPDDVDMYAFLKDRIEAKTLTKVLAVTEMTLDDECFSLDWIKSTEFAQARWNWLYITCLIVGSVPHFNFEEGTKTKKARTLEQMKADYEKASGLLWDKTFFSDEDTKALEVFNTKNNLCEFYFRPIDFEYVVNNITQENAEKMFDIFADHTIWADYLPIAFGKAKTGLEPIWTMAFDDKQPELLALLITLFCIPDEETDLRAYAIEVFFCKSFGLKFVSKNSIKFIEYADWDLIRLIFEDYGKD